MKHQKKKNQGRFGNSECIKRQIMRTKIIIPALLSLVLSHGLFAASGGGLIADTTAVGTQVSLQDQTFAITGGTARSGNLLHSFREFNVETGQTADFQATAGTQNIISRVTGTNDSWIDGQIKSTTSEADLYLVNPNGIVMGKNASLDVQGAFHATTADYVTLADGQRVFAEADQGVALTVAAPEAFGFLDDSAGQIRIDGSQLQVQAGEVLSLVGGEITLESSARLRIPGGRVDLVGVASDGEVRLASDQISNTVANRANITLNDSTVDVNNQTDSTTIGRIRVQGAQISANNGQLRADNHSMVDATGNQVELQADTIRLTGSQITTIVNNSGQGGSVRLEARDQVGMHNSLITMETRSETADAGDGGDLVIQATDITLTDDTAITAETRGSGAGGSVWLEARDQVAMHNSAITMATYSELANAGKGGDLIIQATDITLATGTVITAETLSSGQGGPVRLVAIDQIRLSGQDTQINSSSHGPGAAGTVRIQAANLTLTATARVESTSGFVDQMVDSDLPRTGAAGQIEIDLSGVLHMSGNSKISTSTEGSGDAGNIRIGETSRPMMLWLEDGARITSGSEASAADAGDAGRLVILASEQIHLRGNSALTTASKKSGGGGIQVETRDLLYLQDGRITTSVAGGTGQGGNIEIDPVFIILENSRIQANAHGGDGGNITLVADYLLQSGTSVIEASSELSASGNINVQAVTVDAGSLQVVSQADPLDVAQWQPTPCDQRRGKVSRLTMAGYDAHPAPMDDILSTLPLYNRLQSLHQLPEYVPAATMPQSADFATDGCWWRTSEGSSV